MKTRHLSLFLTIVVMMAACATAPPPLPVSTDAIADLPVDPRLGFQGSDSRPGDSAALGSILATLRAGERQEAIRRLSDLERKSPAYLPAALTSAAFALLAGDLDRAAGGIERAWESDPLWTAAAFYRAELLAQRGEEAAALETLRRARQQAQIPPVAETRIADLERRRYDQLYSSAVAATPAAAIPQLREALALRPDSEAARLLLVQKLVAAGQLADARMEIDPLLSSAESERSEIQQALAEIEFGRQRYEDAISRYEKIVRKDPRPEYVARLDEIKRQFTQANLPPRFRAAAASTQLTRAELATLIHWTIDEIRFGRIPREPTIAVDIGSSPGREEMVRAIAFGLFAVDPITRRVGPDRSVSPASAARTLHRVLTIRGTGCGSGTSSAIEALRACGVDVRALEMSPETALSGAWALSALQQIARAS